MKKIGRRTIDSACRFPNDCTLGKIASFREKNRFTTYLDYLNGIFKF